MKYIIPAQINIYAFFLNISLQYFLDFHSLELQPQTLLLTSGHGHPTSTADDLTNACYNQLIYSSFQTQHKYQYQYIAISHISITFLSLSCTQHIDLTNSIPFSRPPQFISPSLHPQHPSTLYSPSYLLQTTHINHPLSGLFSSFPPF